MDNYCRIIYVDMPVTCKAFTFPDCNGYYTIYLNSKHTAEQNNVSLLHEIEHIKNGDFDSYVSVEILEMILHAS